MNNLIMDDTMWMALTGRHIDLVGQQHGQSPPAEEDHATKFEELLGTVATTALLTGIMLPSSYQ